MKLKLILATALIALATACGTAPPLVTETMALQSVTAARTIATASLREGKISLIEDQKAQAALNVIAIGIKAAVASGDTAKLTALKAEADAKTATLKAAK